MLRLWRMSETTQVQSLAAIAMPKMLATLPLPPPHHDLWPTPSLSSTFSLGSVTQQDQSQFFHHSSACPFPYQIIDYLFFHIIKLFSHCIGLNKNDPPHRLIYLNNSSSISGTVWKGMRVVTVLEEVCYWGWVFRFQRLLPFRMFLWLVSVSQDVSSLLLLWCRGYLSAAILYHDGHWL